MRLAQRVQRIAESATLRVTRRTLELKAQGHQIIDLSAGQPDFASPRVAVDAAQRALERGFTRYTMAAGIPDLRIALAERFATRWGAPWELPNVIITVGAKAALFELILALVEEGDEVVLPSPAWVSFPEQIRLAGGRPVTVPMSAEDGFAIRADAIIGAISSRTRVVLINSPCNPTGGMLPASDLRQLAEHCAQRGIVLLSDETYERFVYGDIEFTSAASLASEFPETVVVVGSFSKTYAMTGWRVGYALAGESVVEKLVTLQGHMMSNVTSFAMCGALAALGNAEADVCQMIEAFKQRRDFVVRQLADFPGVRCCPPDGAFYVFPNVADCYRDGRHGSIELAEAILEETRVAVVPGAAFGANDHIRISFACSREDLEAGLSRMRAVL